MLDRTIGCPHDASFLIYSASKPFVALLVHLLAERFKVTQAVGRYKAISGLPAADPGREERQIARLRQLAVDADLDPEFSEKFLRFIIDEVIRHHQQLRG